MLLEQQTCMHTMMLMVTPSWAVWKVTTCPHSTTWLQACSPHWHYRVKGQACWHPTIPYQQPTFCTIAIVSVWKSVCKELCQPYEHKVVVQHKSLKKRQANDPVLSFCNQGSMKEILFFLSNPTEKALGWWCSAPVVCSACTLMQHTNHYVTADGKCFVSSFSFQSCYPLIYDSIDLLNFFTVYVYVVGSSPEDKQWSTHVVMKYPMPFPWSDLHKVLQ